MSDPVTTNRPGFGARTAAFVFGIAGFLLFIGITLFFKYRAGSVDAYEAQRAAKRIQFRDEVNKQAHELLTTSGWTDQGKGIVRIPLEDAIALELVALKQKTPRAGGLINPPAPAPAPAPAKPAPASTASQPAKPATSAPAATNPPPAPPAAPAGQTPPPGAPAKQTTSSEPTQPAAAPAPSPTMTNTTPANAQPAPKK